MTEATDDLTAIAERLDADDLAGAIRRLRSVADRVPLPELAALLGRAATAAGFDDLAAATAAVAAAPNSAQALYDTGYACIERGVPALAVPFLTAGLAVAPGQRAIITELVTAYEDTHRYGDAVAVLEANESVLLDWPDRYLLAFNTLMSGDVAGARRRTTRLSTPDTAWTHARRRIAAMLDRAETVPGPLDNRSLRAWHFVLNGSVLAHVSPYGYDDGMNGRYAFTQDSPASCRRTLTRLAAVLTATGRAPTTVSLLPDRSSRIFGLAAATVLGLPALPWQSGRRDTVVVAYDLRDVDGDLLTGLRDRGRDSILVEHATCWTAPPPFAAEFTGLLHQTVIAPWGERLVAPQAGTPQGGVPRRSAPDARPEADIAADIVTASERHDDPAPGDTDADLTRFAEAVRAAWPPPDPQRDRVWSPGPVRSGYFH